MRRKVLATAVVAALTGTAAFQAVTTTASTASSSHGTSDPVYLNTRYSPEERAADLVSRMTLAEKASQMNSSRAAAIPRLGVAAYGWWNEAAHGVAREQTTDNSNPPILTNTTSYPVSLSLGSTWNPELMYDEASLIGDEARDVVQDNQRDLDFWSPTVNLGRDPRWGRNDETYSEDPYLTTAIASKFVNGMEGKDENGRLLREGRGYLKTLTTLKHFAANNSEFNRRNGSSDMDDRTLREYYTAQFRSIVQKSQPGSIMSSYNRVNGTPAAADVYLIDTLARKTFGFKGYFTSDCDAIYEIQAGHKWQPPGYPRPLNQVERHAFANSAGEDLDCNQGYHDQYNYANTVPTAVAQGITTQTGLYTENDVDVSVVRLFTARMRLGEFDDESKVPWVREARKRLAPGTWTNSDANNAVTQTPERLAMARKAADQSLVLLKNDAVKASGKRAATLLPLQVPRRGSYKVAVVGPYANPESMYLGGYSSIQGAAGKSNQVNGFQGISKAVKAIDPQATVDYLPGLSADHNTVIAADVAKTKGYDAVVVYAGTDNKTADEDTDRKSLALPGAQAQLIEQVADANPRTVAYLETMGQVDVESFKAKVPAILWSSYNGQRKGEGLADVLLGRHNPSGHLPFTWYRSVDQLPDIADYGIRPTATTQGRTYQYFTGPVSYAFGHGLGYSSFRYSQVRVNRSSVDANGRVTVTARATNTGRATGTDVVQLYAATPDASPALERPIKRLAGFERVTLKPGRSTTVRMQVKIADLAFYDEARKRYAVDQGRYELQLASSSRNVLGRATTRVRGSLDAVPSVVTANPHTAADAARDVPQRVFFAKGDVIDPQVTVTLSDDRIFGHVTKGRSVDLPAGMTVTYRSNRPQVVDVSRRGVVKATGKGVATVTAKVRYHGRTATGTFVVHVG
ncbi:family 3 glycosyl hydrolase [Aeromicrobium sp. S22]|uniref:glycoside hydrolase family 3 C-terminal domain-containing protein n=1 Tax=Aeromicrobium sp. S22 TaxID=2662029 RepID=UPI00129DA725|nr:glycoside hydrolase family 3 C-terminal domain-containing protein [Aeromicrobium sp. S22]MRK03211.1 family 3 glycosyl hydrolase [Aeromicrobium sp. S22]